MRFQDAEGRLHEIVLAVPAGRPEVRVFLDGTTYVLQPEEVAKLRRVYGEALAAALEEKGSW